MNMAPEVDPRPGRVPEQDPKNPKIGFRMVAALCIVFGKNPPSVV